MPDSSQGAISLSRGLRPAALEPAAEADETTGSKEERAMRVQVGKEAADFEANAFIPGEGFKSVKLSDYKGKWIVLFFYPGDFTFV